MRANIISADDTIKSEDVNCVISKESSSLDVELDDLDLEDE